MTRYCQKRNVLWESLVIASPQLVHLFSVLQCLLQHMKQVLRAWFDKTFKRYGTTEISKVLADFNSRKKKTNTMIPSVVLGTGILACPFSSTAGLTSMPATAFTMLIQTLTSAWKALDQHDGKILIHAILRTCQMGSRADTNSVAIRLFFESLTQVRDFLTDVHNQTILCQ